MQSKERTFEWSFDLVRRTHIFYVVTVVEWHTAMKDVVNVKGEVKVSTAGQEG